MLEDCICEFLAIFSAHLSSRRSRLVFKLPLLNPPSLLLILLQHHVLVLVELDRLLVQLVHGVHHRAKLGLQGVGGAKVKELGATDIEGETLLHLQHQRVHQVRVLDHDRDLGEHRFVTDVKVFHRVGSEVSLLEHLNGLLGHPVKEEFGGMLEVSLITCRL